MIKAAEFEAIHVVRPDQEGEDAEFVVWINFEAETGKVIGNSTKLAVSFPFDASLSYAEIMSRSVAELREMLSDAADVPAERWIEMFNQRLEPPKPFKFEPNS